MRSATHHHDFEMAAPQQQMGRDDPEIKQAKSQSKLALVRLPISKQWEQAFKNIRNNEGWDGFVLDMGEGP
jgi:hypothetical protein